MDAPPDNEDCRPFVAVARYLRELGLNVPIVYEADFDQGFLLLSDLGSDHYLDLLEDKSREGLYADAIDALIVMQSSGKKDGLPAYSSGLLLQEMNLFREWLLGRYLGLYLDVTEQQMLDNLSELLIANALEQPQVFVHRDYHSRNLLVMPESNPGILDFQDAVIGPVTYDLVSLLKDCYISWPRQQVKEWVLGYYARAVESEVLLEGQESQLLRWFDLIGVQRHLKASGIFARLNIRDGKTGYMKDIPRTLNYILEIAPEYPELEQLSRTISERVLTNL
jgi:aminoglycoside/choline kinase family phosphotransferase